MLIVTEEQRGHILDLCRWYGPTLGLNDLEPVGARVLYAIFSNERYNAANAVPRIEAAYCPNGRYYVPTLYAKYGVAIAKSYSNWQIMALVAHELGYRGNPEDLDNDDVAITWVCELMRKRILRMSRKDDSKATLAEVLDAYNSGNPRDGNVPLAYITKGQTAYTDSESLFAAHPINPCPALGPVPSDYAKAYRIEALLASMQGREWP